MPRRARYRPIASFLVSWMWSGMAAFASADTFGLGDGHSGALTVSTSGRVVNVYSALSTNAAAGDTGVSVASTAGFAAGDLVLIYQAQDSIAATSGAQATVDLTATKAGLWELARVNGLGANQLQLSAPLLSGFTAGLSQAIKVPEYSSVTINAGSSIDATPWNGSSGGVVAFFVTGTLSNAGGISSAGAGFRGGVLLNGNCSTLTYTGMDGSDNGPKGEGVVTGRYGTTFVARGNVANAAGGGNNCNAGGGGGGHGGQGGVGGNNVAPNSAAVGGLGGAALSYPLTSRFAFGGGGGAGNENQNLGGAGGRGGGAVFIRARSLVGTGVVSANGAVGGNGRPGPPSDGAGGGGAGGSIYLLLSQAAQCGGITANGGGGGNTIEMAATGGPCGPGGGGGGGRVLLQTPDNTACAVTAVAGTSGTQPDNGFPANYGSGPTNGAVAPFTGGTQVISSPFTGPPSQLAFAVGPSNAMAGSVLAPSVQVQVQDSVGNTVTSSSAAITVALGANPGGSVLSGTQTLSASGGTASFSTLSLDRVGSGYTLVASSPGLPPATSNAFDVVPGAAARLAFTTPPSNVAAGASISPSIQVSIVDASGDVVTSSTASITLALAQNPGSSTLGGTVTRAAVAGIASFGDLSLDRTGSGYTLTALSSPLAPATSTPFNVTGTAPVNLVFSSVPASAEEGVPFIATVSVVDANGQALTGYTGRVSLSSSDPNAVLDPPYLFGVGESSHPFSVQLNSRGLQTLTATDNSSAPLTTSAAINVTSVLPTTLERLRFLVGCGCSSTADSCATVLLLLALRGRRRRR